MMSCRLHAFATLHILIFMCCSAMANPTCPTPPSSNANARTLASHWFAIGTERVAAGDFSGGREAFLCSHTLVPHPASLLNAALASHRANELTYACSLYEQFLEISEDDEKNAKVRVEMQSLQCEATSPATMYTRRRIDNTYPMTADDADVPKTSPENATASEHLKTQAPSDPASVPAPNRTLQISRTPYQLRSPLPRTGTVLLISGATTLTAGTVFQLMAAWNKNKGEETTNGNLFELYQANTERYQQIANIGFISGSVLFVTGLAFHIAASRLSHSESNMAVSRVFPWRSGILFTYSF